MRIGLNSAAIGLAALLTAGGAEARDVAAFWRSTLATAPDYGGAQRGIMLAECQRGYAILRFLRVRRDRPRSCGRLTAGKS